MPHRAGALSWVPAHQLERREQKSANSNYEGGGKKTMSGFGLYVWKLMASRELTQQKELVICLRTVGYETSAQNVSNWLHGTHPPPEFIRALTRCLRLNPAEEAELYRKYAWETRLSAV